MNNVIFFLLPAICAGIANFNSSGDNLNKHRNFASYISKNFASFKREAAIATGKEIAARRVDEIMDVSIVEGESEEDGSLLVFDDSSGFLLVGDDKKLYDYSFDGALSFKGVEGKLEYFVDSDSFNIPIDYEKTIMSASMSSPYNGQLESGCGAIINTNTYMSSRFGSGWSCVTSKSLAMQPFHQYDLSCYIDTNTWCSEGNCGMVSAYHALQYIQSSKGYRNMPSYNQTWYYYDPYIYEPSEYLKRFTITGEQKYPNCVLNTDKLDSFPELYKVTRQISANEIGKIENLTVDDTSSLIKKVLNSYNISAKTRVDVMWKIALDEAMRKIDSRETLCFSLFMDETYGSHTMAVCGYKKYQKTSRFLWFDTVETKVLFKVCDGWDSSARFYDMTTSATLGSFVFVEF